MGERGGGEQMNAVSPIRDAEKVKRVKREAARMGDQQYLLILLGLNTGLRVSDLLQVRVSDIRDRGYILRREQKTGKQTEVRFHESVVEEMRKKLAGRRGDELLFASPHINRRGQPINRDTAYKWVVTACRRAGIREPVGCHTLRKTYGYHFYQQYKDIATLMLKFNHTDESVTLRYIGVTQDHINAKTTRFRL